MCFPHQEKPTVVDDIYAISTAYAYRNNLSIERLTSKIHTSTLLLDNISVLQCVIHMEVSVHMYLS